MKRFIAAVLMVGGVLVPSAAEADPPRLQRLLPVAAAPGQTVDITLLGNNLERPTSLWTNLQAGIEIGGGGPKNGKPKRPSRTASSCRPKRRWASTESEWQTSGGVSNLRLLVVDDLLSPRSRRQ